MMFMRARRLARNSLRNSDLAVQGVSILDDQGCLCTGWPGQEVSLTREKVIYPACESLYWLTGCSLYTGWPAAVFILAGQLQFLYRPGQLCIWEKT